MKTRGRTNNTKAKKESEVSDGQSLTTRCSRRGPRRSGAAAGAGERETVERQVIYLSDISFSWNDDAHTR
jgi:hypothetical protein